MLERRLATSLDEAPRGRLGPYFYHEKEPRWGRRWGAAVRSASAPTWGRGGAMCRRVASDRRERLGSNRKVNTRGSVAAIRHDAVTLLARAVPAVAAPSHMSPQTPT